jgi:hypothetical protein
VDVSAELWRYLIWAIAVLLGAWLAVVDRRMMGRWLFGLLLIAAIVGGLLITVISPFSFGSTSYFMHGVIISGGAALALAGYVLTVGGLFVGKHLARLQR